MQVWQMSNLRGWFRDTVCKAQSLARFTDRARQVMRLASEQALRVDDDYVRTEHVLFGVLAERSGAFLLENCGIGTDDLRDRLARTFSTTTPQVGTGKAALSAGVIKVIECANEESRLAGDPCVGTGHLITGLLLEGEGIAARLLEDAGFDPVDFRKSVWDMRVRAVDEFARQHPIRSRIMSWMYRMDRPGDYRPRVWPLWIVVKLIIWLL